MELKNPLPLHSFAVKALLTNVHGMSNTKVTLFGQLFVVCGTVNRAKISLNSIVAMAAARRPLEFKVGVCASLFPIRGLSLSSRH